MHKAVKDNDVEAVARLLAEGGDVNERDSLERTPLHLAAWRGNPDTIRTLLDAGADVLALAQDGYAALHFAVNSESLAAVEALLRKSMNAQIKLKLYKNKRTALHLAAAKNNLEIVRCLLSRGADPLALSKSGETASALATETAVMDAILSTCQERVKLQKDELMKLGKRPVAPSDDHVVKAPTHAAPAAAAAGEAVSLHNTAAVGAAAESGVTATEEKGLGGIEDKPVERGDDVVIDIRPLKRKMKPLYAPPKIKLGHLGDEEED
jgi:hypothetical protein